ncbi:MAG: Na+/H+-dicarboxylate symporter, partial [Cognaticolwellia sp.]
MTSTKNTVAPKKSSLTTRIIIGMISGIALGTFLQWLMPNGRDLVLNLFFFKLSLQNFLVDGVLEIIGQIFMASLRMLVVPLVFVSLVCGVCSLQ